MHRAAALTGAMHATAGAGQCRAVEGDGIVTAEEWAARLLSTWFCERDRRGA